MELQSAHIEYDVAAGEIRHVTVEDGEPHYHTVRAEQFKDVDKTIMSMARVYKRMGFKRVTSATINY